MTPQEIATLKKRYASIPMRYDIQYTQFQIKGSDFTITAYKSGKVVFQAEDLSIHIPQSHQGIQTPTKKEAKPTKTTAYSNYDRAGSDEVGTGDYFGPMVVSAAYVSKEDLKVLPLDRIKDTKSIKDDAKIQELAKIIKPLIKYSVVVITPDAYNQLNERGENKNKILAKMHNKAFLELDKKVALPNINIIDDFTNGREDLYYDRYLANEKEVFTKLHFEKKAEDKYYAVACAAIIARDTFVEAYHEMSEEYGLTFQMGAGEVTDTMGKEFVKKHGEDKLHHVAKISYANTKRIIDI